MHLIWNIYYYELVTGMEKDIHVSHKGQGVTRTKAGAVTCENGLARTLTYDIGFNKGRVQNWKEAILCVRPVNKRAICMNKDRQFN